MQIKEVHIRWMGIPVLAVVMAMIYGLDEGQLWWQKYLESLLYCAFYWNGACHMFFFYRRRFPLIKETPKRLALTTLSLMAFLLIGDFVICLFIHGDINNVQDYDLLHSVPSLIAGTVVGLVYEAVYFFQQWKQTIKVNEALKSQQMRTQFEVLQNQMSPHFLFNSLNTLTALIPEDPDIAVEFTQKLSEVYRYILKNKERELVSVEEELNFAQAYVFLLKMRYPENLNVSFSLEAKHEKQYIAPLTLQMLIENAIKHNVVSKMHPLFIDVYVENGKSVVVKNNLQKKNVIEKSTKTGLANIQKRYELLGNREIDIMTTARNFIVAVPLIDLVHQAEYETDYPMKVLIIEDEAPAFRRLQKILDELRPGIEIIDVIDSVEDSTKWLKNHNAPDLIFMDIQLSDGISFEIFDQVKITSPVVFTTAFDEYMLRAFKVNSIDYLLKPIKTEELSQSLEKYENLRSTFGAGQDVDINALIKQITLDDKKYKSRFLVKKGERLLSIETADIAYFQTRNGVVSMVTLSGKKHLVDYTLDELSNCLDPTDFFRANRQYLIQFPFISEVHKYHKGKLLIEGKLKTEEPILISEEKSSLFKKWLDQ